VFLGFIVNKNGVHVDPKKIKAIQEWPTQQNVGDVRSFHNLESFYKRFVPNFSSLASPLNELVKKSTPFCWTEKQDQAFKRLKAQLTNAPILALPNFAKIFELECDASGVGIGVVLLQGGHPIAYFSEKLHGATLNYLTYDKELYALVRALKNWEHYLVSKEFVIHSDHESLKYLKGQHKYEHRAHGGFYVSEGYLFKEEKLCIPQGTYRKLLVKESHEGGFMGQFGVDKTLELLKEKFFWPPMRKDVQRHYHRCISCLKTISKAMSHELYAPSPFASAPWEDISIGFILELLRTTKGFDSIFMVLDKLFFREVVRLHGLSPSILLDRDPKFDDHFLRILLEKLGTKLNFSISYHSQTNGRNEVENITLSIMPRVITRDNHNSRDEYAYNRVVHKTTNISPFEVVYGFDPLSPLDLLPLPNPHTFVHKEGATKDEFVKKMHERIKEQIQQQIEKYYKKLPKTIEKQEE